MFLTKFQPRTNRVVFRSPFHQAFHDSVWPSPFFRVRPHVRPKTLPIDLIEKDEEFVVRAVVPGFEPKQIDISVQADLLTLSGEVKEENETNKENYHVREFSSGSFQRKVRLPADVDSDKATADYKNGILTIHLPKAQANGVKKIAVKS